MEIKKENIIEYVNLVLNKEFESIEVSLFDDVKKHILKNEKFNNNFIQKHVIDNIDRTINNSHKDKDFKLNQETVNLIAEYIIEITTNEKHFFYQFKDSIIRCINEKAFKGFIWVEDEMIFLLIAIIEHVKSYYYLLEVCKIDEKYNLNKKRDKVKIENAIDLLKQYTNDLNVDYYLDTIKAHKKDVTEETIYSCFFCQLTKMIKEIFPSLPNYQLENISKDIISITLNIENIKDYRIYNNIEHLEYKGFKLRRYTNK